MSLPRADVFTKISDDREKTRLLVDLTKLRGELVCKYIDPNAEIFKLKALSVDGGRLTAQAAAGKYPAKGELTLNFSLAGEKYFFSGLFERRHDTFSISLAEDLYHLQRREDYRIRIPSSVNAIFECSSLNGKPSKFSVPLVDLSAGGCKIMIETLQYALKMNDELQGHLFLPDRNPIDFHALIKYIRPDPQKKTASVVGLQFVRMPEVLKNRIAAVVMDLYREFFTRTRL